MNKSALLAAAMACMFSVEAAAAATDYPLRPVTIIVPVSPGGTVDMVARIVAKGLSEELGQPFVVENKAGASGAIGTRHVAQAAPDGHTLLAVANTFASVPQFLADAGYDPLRDFAPVTQTCSIPMVLVTHPEKGAASVEDLIRKAQARPESVSIGSAGMGSTGYIAAELFSEQAAVSFLHVFYKGNNPALLDVMAGRLDGMFDQVSTANPNVKAGKLRPLAVTTSSRSAMLPDVPTLDEAGLRGFQDETFNGILAPAGTPDAVVSRLHAAISKILSQADVRRQLGEQGIDVRPSESPAAFADYLGETVATYRKIAARVEKK